MEEAVAAKAAKAAKAWRTHQPTDPPTHRPTNPQTHRPTNTQTHKHTIPPTHRPTDPQTHRPTHNTFKMIATYLMKRSLSDRNTKQYFARGGGGGIFYSPDSSESKTLSKYAKQSNITDSVITHDYVVFLLPDSNKRASTNSSTKTSQFQNVVETSPEAHLSF